MDTAKFKLSNDSAYGGAVCYLDLTADGFDEDGLNTVVVEAEGHRLDQRHYGHQRGGQGLQPDKQLPLRR